ncbi:MAG: (2Fe-2S)-binding protein [Gemmataceae bacterium]
MDDDAKVCYCFRVTRRKLLSFIRAERPRVASQLSLCNGAGTGCGWCVPFLKKLFAGESVPLSADDYAAGRADYLRQGKGTPPAGAEP